MAVLPNCNIIEPKWNVNSFPTAIIPVYNSEHNRTKVECKLMVGKGIVNKAKEHNRTKVECK